MLVGNFGNGQINDFDSRGRFIDEIDGPNDKPLVIDGLWTLTLGGGAKSSSDTLYFTDSPGCTYEFRLLRRFRRDLLAARSSLHDP